MTEISRWLTVSQAAARSGRCAATIRGQFDAGRLAGERNVLGHRLIDPASLDALDDPGLSVSQAASQLGRSVDTVRRWFDTGYLAGRRDHHGRRRIDPTAVQRLLNDPRPPCPPRRHRTPTTAAPS
jgi:excisionase family DNA binding protein